MIHVPDRPYPDPDTEPRGPTWDDRDEADTRADAAYDRYREDCGAARRKLLAAADAMDEAAEARARIDSNPVGSKAWSAACDDYEFWTNKKALMDVAVGRAA